MNVMLLELKIKINNESLLRTFKIMNYVFYFNRFKHILKYIFNINFSFSKKFYNNIYEQHFLTDQVFSKATQREIFVEQQWKTICLMLLNFYLKIQTKTNYKMIFRKNEWSSVYKIYLSSNTSNIKAKKILVTEIFSKIYLFLKPDQTLVTNFILL